MAEAEWRVGDLVTLQRGTTYEGALVGEDGPALLGLGSIEPGGGFRGTHFRTFGGACTTKIMVASGELFVALKGATKDGSMVGSIARVPSWLQGGGRLTQDTARLDFRDAGRGHESYLYWMLRTPQYRAYCAGRITGSASASFSRDDFLNYRFPAPNPSRTRVVETLGVLDDKIELNRRLSETLHTTARALFKSWFMGGTGTEADGWRPSVIGQEFEVTMGQSPPGSTYNSHGDGLPFYQGRADFGTRFPARRVYCTAPTRTARAGDTLLSVRAPVGDINIATEACAIGRGVAAVRHRSGSRSFTFEFFNSIRGALDEYNASGTVFGAIGGKDLSAMPCLAPPDDLVREFDEQAQPLDERLENLERQRQTLTEVRNAMLPRLLSGEMSPSIGRGQGA